MVFFFFGKRKKTAAAGEDVPNLKSSPQRTREKEFRRVQKVLSALPPRSPVLCGEFIRLISCME